MDSHERKQRIAANWSSVLQSVQGATRLARRDPSSVQIIGVSKYVDAETTAMLVDAGCHDLGENRPQSLWEKADALQERSEIRWHMIGHLQRNKVRRSLPHLAMIHSVDSPRLFNAISAEAGVQNKSLDVLLEVNVSGEENKTGMSPDVLRSVIEKHVSESHSAANPDSNETSAVEIQGLMAMAGWGTDEEQARSQFARVRELRDALASEFGLPLQHLSMGMSGDYAAAIAEGATMVRIGSALFEGVMER